MGRCRTTALIIFFDTERYRDFQAAPINANAICIAALSIQHSLTLFTRAEVRIEAGHVTLRSRLDVNTRNAYIVGMESMQYTIRGILPWMDERLRAKAKKERKSLNAVAVEILMRGLNPDNPEAEYHDMDDLIGTWVHDPDTDESLASMDTIDEELWR